MRLLTLLGAVAVLTALPLAASAGVPQGLDKRLKIKPRQFRVHPRRTAFNFKDGRHQIRLQGRKDRHKTRREVRKVTHKLTTPHKPN